MKKLSLAVALAALMVAPNVGRTATGTVNATAIIAPPLRIVATQTLDFGELLTDGLLAGQYDIAANGTATPSNLTQVGTSTAGQFELRGRAGETVATLSIAFDAATVACVPVQVGDCVGGGTTTLAFQNPIMDQVAPLILPGAVGLGVQPVNYGASIVTAIDQEPGQYTNTLTVTAAY